MENLKTVLAEARLTFKNVLKATVFITDLKRYGNFNAPFFMVYFFVERGHAAHA